MNKKILSLFVAILISLSGGYAQNTITVNAVGNDISENLDLEAVATLFGESKNLENFETRLNDPRNQISNLDLNQDGYVDYIRLVESTENGVYIITLQDVLGNDQFQDVATIDVGKNSEGYTQIEIVGNPYFYGPNYIIQPIYENTPVIFSIFWNPYYRLWISPYYWNFYPHFFHPWRPSALSRYRMHINAFRRAPQYYRYINASSNHNNMVFHNKAFRNDYERMHPDRSFNHRNQGYKNARELYQKRNDFNHNVKPNDNRKSPNRNVGTKPVRVNKAPAKYRNTPKKTETKRPTYNNNKNVNSVRVNKAPANFKSREIKPAMVRSSENRNVRVQRKNTPVKKEKQIIKRAPKGKKETIKDNKKDENKDKKK